MRHLLRHVALPLVGGLLIGWLLGAALGFSWGVIVTCAAAIVFAVRELVWLRGMRRELKQIEAELERRR